MTRDVITNCKSSNRLGVIRRRVDLIREENFEIHTDNFDIIRGGGSISFRCQNSPSSVLALSLSKVETVCG